MPQNEKPPFEVQVLKRNGMIFEDFSYYQNKFNPHLGRKFRVSQLFFAISSFLFSSLIRTRLNQTNSERLTSIGWPQRPERFAFISATEESLYFTTWTSYWRTRGNLIRVSSMLAAASYVGEKANQIITRRISLPIPDTIFLNERIRRSKIFANTAMSNDDVRSCRDGKRYKKKVIMKLKLTKRQIYFKSNKIIIWCKFCPFCLITLPKKKSPVYFLCLLLFCCFFFLLFRCIFIFLNVNV